MSERLCKVCGWPAQPGETSCAECGAPLPEEERVQEPETKEIIQETPEEGRRPRRRRWIALVLALCILAGAGGFALWRLWPRYREPMYLPYEGGGVLCANGFLVTPEGYWRLEEDTWATGQSAGDTLLLVEMKPEEAVCSLFDGEKLTRHPDWMMPRLSGLGTAVFYVTQEGKEKVLWREGTAVGEAEEIDRGTDISGVLAAWDGSTLYYYVQEAAFEDSAPLWSARLWTEEGVREIGKLSTAKWVVALGKKALLEMPWSASSIYMDQEGYTLTWLEEDGEPLEFDQLMAADRDLEEFIYRKGDRVYYEAAGKAPVDLDLTLEPDDRLMLCAVTPSGITGGWQERLLDWVYYVVSERDWENRLIYIGDDCSVRVLAQTEARNAWMDAEGNTLLYIDGEGRLMRMEDPRSPWAKGVPAAGADLDGGAFLGSMQVPPGLECAYYINAGKEVLYIPAGGESRRVFSSSDFYLQVMTLSGGGCYILSGSNLYYTEDGAIARPVEVEGMGERYSMIALSSKDKGAILGEDRVWLLTPGGVVTELKQLEVEE